MINRGRTLRDAPEITRHDFAPGTLYLFRNDSNRKGVEETDVFSKRRMELVYVRKAGNGRLYLFARGVTNKGRLISAETFTAAQLQDYMITKAGTGNGA